LQIAAYAERTPQRGAQYRRILVERRSNPFARNSLRLRLAGASKRHQAGKMRTPVSSLCHFCSAPLWRNHSTLSSAGSDAQSFEPPRHRDTKGDPPMEDRALMADRGWGRHTSAKAKDDAGRREACLPIDGEAGWEACATLAGRKTARIVACRNPTDVPPISRSRHSDTIPWAKRPCHSARAGVADAGLRVTGRVFGSEGGGIARTHF
jgi:hypothetical protein